MTVRHPHRRVDLTADPRFNSNAFDAAALFGSQCAVSSKLLTPPDWLRACSII